MAPPKEDMLYDGDDVEWYGVGSFNATSGLPGNQVASDETQRDKGPIPEGVYSFHLFDGGTARVTNVAQNKIAPAQGIQSLVDMPAPDGKFYNSSDWGQNRVRLNPLLIKNPKARHRSGFYLHDSTKGYSHGCIETNPLFFIALRFYAAAQRATGGRKSLVIKVEYPTDGTSTYGGTKI